MESTDAISGTTGAIKTAPRTKVAAIDHDPPPEHATKKQPRTLDSDGLVSVIVPLYNEETLAQRCYQRLSHALVSTVESFQIILVDDGSTDRTYATLLAATAQDERTQIIRLPRNAGQHQATLIGMRAASGDIIITIDCDLEVEGRHIKALLDCLASNSSCEVASAVRGPRAGGLLRSAASNVVTWLVNLICRAHLRDPGCTLKAMRRSVVDQALQNEILAQNLPMFVAYAGFEIKEVDVGRLPHGDRQSRYDFAGLVMTLALVLLNYSSGARFLSALLVIGSSMVFAGFLSCLAIVVRGMTHQAALPTNLLLAGLLAVGLGGQFVALSILGYKLESLTRNLRLRGIPAQFRTGGYDSRPKSVQKEPYDDQSRDVEGAVLRMKPERVLTGAALRESSGTRS